MTREQFHSNCLFWALSQWTTQGGYIAARRSYHWRFIPHFLWSKDLQVWRGFVPLHPKRGLLVLLHCWWFLGHVVEEQGDRNGLL